MSMIRGTPDDHLLPRTVDSDEIAALEGNDSPRGGLGDGILFDIFGRNFPTSGLGHDILPVGPGHLPGTKPRRHPRLLAERGRLHRRPLTH